MEYVQSQMDRPGFSELISVISLNMAVLKEAALKSTPFSDRELQSTCNALSGLLDQGDASRARKIAYVLMKLEQRNFWWHYFYLRAVLPSQRRARMIVSACEVWPQHLAELAVLYDSVDKVSTEGRECLVHLTRSVLKSGQARGWGGVILARAWLDDAEGAGFAKSILCSMDPAIEPKFIRARAARLEYEITRRESSPNQNLEELNPLICSAAILDPYSLDTSQAVLQFLDTVWQSSSRSIQHDPEEFVATDTDYLISGIDSDISHAEICRNLTSRWLHSSEIDTFTQHPPVDTSEKEILVARDEIQVAGAKFWSRYNDEPALVYNTSDDGFRTGWHANLNRRILRGVYYRYGNGFTHVMTEDHRLIRGCSFGPAMFASGSKLPNEVDYKFANSNVIMLALGYGDDNFCHFLMDRVPLLAWFAEQDFESKSILIEPKLAGWLEQVIAMLGLKLDIQTIEPNVTYQLGTVSIFSPTQHPGQYWPSEYRQFFGKLSKRKIAGTRRIFIARPKGRRGLRNEDEIHGIAIEKGFEIIRLEQHSIREQAQLFAEAEFIAGAHGAGFANIVFAHPGTRVLELVRRGYMTASFSITSACFGFPYAILLDEASEANSIDAGTKFEDLQIDPGKFSNIIDDLLGVVPA